MNKLHQIVDKPSRITLQSATLLNVTVTRTRDAVLQADVTPSVIVDHDLITATIDISEPERAVTMRTFRHMGAYSNDALWKALLDHTPELNNIYHTDDINTQLNILATVFTRCLDERAPVIS